MPATYTIDRVNKVVLSAAFGTLTMEDAVGQINQLLADPAFNSSYGQLLDFRNVGSVNLTPSQIRQLAEYALFSPSAKRAFVSPTPLLEALARMYVAQREMAGDTGIGIFRTIEEARAWLGLSKTSLPV
jgi:hypothetical protein